MHTTGAAPRAAGGRTPHDFATAGVLLVAAVVGLGHLAASFCAEYWFDEAYMLAMGRYHLDWGYVDQPPLVPALAAAMDWLVPGSTVVLRLPAVLASTAAVVLAALIARELGADRRAQIIAAIAQPGALWVTLTGHWMTPYTMEPLVWGLITWLLVRWVRLRQDWLLVLLGLVVGIGTQTKFQVFMLCGALLVSVLVLGPRELLRRPMLWAGIGLALLIALPTLLWQATNGWPQLRMAGVVANESAELSTGGRLGTAVALVALAGIAGSVLLVLGLWRLLRGAELRDYRFLGLTFVLLYLVIVIGGGRFYYLGGIYPLLIAAGAVALQRRRATGRVGLRWMAVPACALSLVSTAGVLVLSSAMTPAATWAANLAGVTSGENLAGRATTVYRKLPQQVRERTAIIGDSYLIAAYIEAYGRRYEPPATYSTNRGYGYLPPPPAERDTVLYVGSRPQAMGAYFGQMRLLSPGTAEDTSVWLLTQRRESWNRIWSELRDLDLANR
ncbi:ArnT family glycosyltransferase [Amycolatopsis aidingensis]|uniref:ArnT family glycosyltransferase n=1 Tax=Amycolatopsis aidingensis TaxID=2842453 RepID=UPI001C0DDA91|nr:glycosyltransferase family 39 protein [Amycolatopsis aidingensis]